MKSSFLGIALATLAGVTACKSDKRTAATVDAAAAASATAQGAPSAAASGPASPLAIPGATVATMPNFGIPQRFAAEQAGRPPGVHPSVEEVYAALEKAGVTIVDRQQHLGAPFGARYCLGARAVGAGNTPMLQISVCEFVSAEAAKVGREYSAEGMKVIPLRTVYANKQTTLTLREEKQTPEIDALVQKAAAVYAKL